MAIAVFNYAVWAARYPKLATSVDEDLATAYFGEACLLLDNSDCSVVCDVNARLTLLNMLVAHIAALNGATASGAAGLVGRISNVTEGSVTIGTQAEMRPGSEAYFMQTPYGYQYWQATLNYRSAFYVSDEPPEIDNALGLWGYGARWPY